MADPVFLTGATGFVGRAVLAELRQQGIPVIALSRTPMATQPDVTWLQGDLLSPSGRSDLMAQCPPNARLIHCAWEVTHGSFWTSPANALWQQASQDLAQRFLAQGGQRLLILGTCAEYDPHASGAWDETRPIAPQTAYGQAKAGLWRDLKGDNDPRMIWARLFHLYGAGEDRRRLVPSLIDDLLAGRVATVRAAKLVRDFASISHVARCLVGLITAPNAHGAFDIGAGRAMCLGDLAGIIATTLQRPQQLALSHSPAPGDPAIMAPQLRRLFNLTGIPPEDPRTALADHVRKDGMNPSL